MEEVGTECAASLANSLQNDVDQLNIQSPAKGWVAVAFT